MKKQSHFIFLSTKQILLPTDKVIRKIGDVVMRPSDGKVAIVNPLTIEDPQECVPQYIYILSDEKPKEKEWSYCGFHLGGKIFKSKGKGFVCNDCKKIIATTNPELHTQLPDEGIKGANYDYGVPEIFQSDIEYIIGLHNGTEKTIDVRTSLEILHTHCKNDIVSGNIEYYRENILEAMEEYKLQDNDKFSLKEMQDYTFEILKEMRRECSDWQKRGLTVSDIGIAQFIKNPPKKYLKNDSVMVEYENEIGYLSENEHDIWKPKTKDGNIIIKKY